MKICTKCNQSKLLDSFGIMAKSKDGHQSWCKLCFSGYTLKTKSIKKQKNTLYYKNNHKEICARSKSYRVLNKTYLTSYHKEYRQVNKEIINNKYKNRYQSDLDFKISKNMRSRLSNSIRRKQKSGSAIKNLGCSISKLKIYLQLQFIRNKQNQSQIMTWDNYGQWHIDHIKPLSSFDLTDKEQLKEACHFTNLQPMWAKENIKKGDKVENF